MPDKWRAEQLANQYQYDHSWEALNAQFGYDSASTGPYDGTPGTYDDYIIAKTEKDLKGGKNGVPLSPPATKAQRFVKTVGGVATAVTGFSLGATFGNATAEFFGFDPDGQVCGSTPENTHQLLGFLTGADCNAWQIAADFVANQDIVPGETAVVCSVADPSKCYTFHFVWDSSVSSPANKLACFTRNFTGTGFSLSWVMANGSTLSAAVPTDRTSGSGTGAACWAVGGSVSGGAQSKQLNYATYVGAGGVVGWKDSSSTETVPITTLPTDPSRTLQCSVLGDNGVTYTSISEPYTETGEQVAAAQCDALPPGVRPANVSVTDSEGNTLYDEDVSTQYAAWWDDYPECRTGACKLDLITLVETPGFPVSCFDLENACDGWFESASRDTDYECHYGIHTVDIDECFVYSGVFNQSRILSGAAYSDPMTGVWSGGQNSPAPDEQAFGQTPQDPDSARRCNGLASDSFDPVAFVMRPVQCALEWAFVPREATVKVKLLELEDGWNSSFLGEMGGIIGQFSEIPIYTGCDGIPIYIEFDWPIEWVLDWNFGESCTGPLAETAALVRIVESAGIILLGIRALTGYLSAVIGFRGFGRQGD